MATDRDVAAEIGVIVEIERADFADVIGFGDEAGRVCDKGCVLEFRRSDRNDAAQLCAHLRLRKDTVVNGERLVGKFVDPVHVLAFDEEIHRIEEAAETDRHVIV